MAAESNLPTYISICAVLLQVVGYFVMAWKGEKDKSDERSADCIAGIEKTLARIEATIEEREKKYNENFKRLEGAINNKRK